MKDKSITSNTFFLVFTDTAPMLADHRHSSRDAAMAEAQRLAREEKRRAFVAECLGAYEPVEPPVAWVGYGNPEKAEMSAREFIEQAWRNSIISTRTREVLFRNIGYDVTAAQFTEMVRSGVVFDFSLIGPKTSSELRAAFLPAAPLGAPTPEGEC